MLVVFVATIFSANRGISVDILRGISETFIVYSILITVLPSKDINKLFIIYIFAFIFFSVWGIIGGGLIRNFMPLDNEDSFGPFMCVGISFAYYIQRVYENKTIKILCFITFILCLAGAVVSFARGTFLSLLLLLIMIFLRSGNKIRLAASTVFLAIIFLITLNVIFPDFYKSYSNEMATIWEHGAEEATAKERIYLWKKAWDMFVDHPLIGVGPGCYGFRLPRYYNQEDRWDWNIGYYQTFEKAVHNIYLQIMAEMGLLGILSLLMILYYFGKRNLFARAFARKILKTNNSQNFNDSLKIGISGVNYSLALEGGMMAFLANSFFFNLLYFTWFWDLLILNTLIYQQMKEIEN